MTIKVGRRRVALAMLFGVCLAGSAIAQDKKLSVVFANFNDEHPFGAAVLKGFHAATDNDKALNVKIFDNRNDPQRAIENARIAASLKPDVFIQYNAQAASNQQVARIMKEAGVPVIAVQVSVPGAPLYAVDNALSGAESGRALVETAKSRWPGVTPRIVIINVPEAGPLFIERGNAAKEVLANAYPAAKIEEFSSRNDGAVTRQVVTDVLIRYPNEKIVVWIHVDPMALAALAGVRTAKRTEDVLIATTGGDTSVFPEIRSGKSPLIGTFSFFPEDWGKEIISMAKRMAAGEKLPDRVSPGRQLFITSKNIGNFYPEKP